MQYCIKTWQHGLSFGNLKLNGFRMISNSEIATALRPFYFVVHPDLFGRFPEQRAVNEDSLKHLSAHFEALQKHTILSSTPKLLPFYVRDFDIDKKGSFKLIKIPVEKNRDPKLVLKRILQTCNLPTEYIDNMKSTLSDDSNVSKTHTNLRDEVDNMQKDFTQDYEVFQERVKRTLNATLLKDWLDANLQTAYDRNSALEELRTEVTKLKEIIAERLELIDLQYDCGWNVEHYRGCLKCLDKLADMHPEVMINLKNRVVVFAPFTGVSLDGHVMLFTGDVQHNWLDVTCLKMLIKNLSKHESYLKKIPAYEYALSQVLCSIKIGRRKFMPKAQAMLYTQHLRKMTTTLLDYLSKYKYPKTWPESLIDYEIVIESEAGPLMVTPTGQLIAPSTCPGSLLVDFITNNLEDAFIKIKEYKVNKYIEIELHKRCLSELKLSTLQKDDSVTPDKMILCLNKLLNEKKLYLTNVNLHITNYYSILSDGTVCIPWDWKS